MRFAHLFASALLVLAPWALNAQHHHGQHGTPATGPTQAAPAADSLQQMPHAFSLSLPMNRNGSGTGWLPDASPMYGYMFHSGSWMFMGHGNVFVRYNRQDVFGDGSRGGAEVDAPNWFMLMGQRRVARNGLFRFSTMLSLDEWIGGGNGYPLLFQSGETFRGRPLVDRQHPHDFVSELSVAYTHRLSRSIDVFGYFGYPGEPALGPVAFMHRPSAMNNPDAPLGHHWQDATHILFGVATLGVRLGILKLEGSTFTGREPDEDRYGFQPLRFDSWSARITANPGTNWALQVSHGAITSPEPLHPEENVRRTTASVHHVAHLAPGGERFVNTSMVWGYNYVDAQHQEHSVLLESDLRLNRWAVYGRYEWLEKSAEELALEDAFGHDAIFPVHTFTLGANYTFVQGRAARLAVGAQASVFAPAAALQPVYGATPLSGQVYLRVFPPLMSARGR